MADLIGASSGSRPSTELPVAPSRNDQAFTAQINDSKEAMGRGEEASHELSANATEDDRKKKSELRRILRKTARQQAKHYVLMNYLQQTDLDAAYQALARQIGAAAALKPGGKP